MYICGQSQMRTSQVTMSMMCLPYIHGFHLLICKSHAKGIINIDEDTEEQNQIATCSLRYQVESSQLQSQRV